MINNEKNTQKQICKNNFYLDDKIVAGIHFKWLLSNVIMK